MLLSKFISVSEDEEGRNLLRTANANLDAIFHGFSYLFNRVHVGQSNDSAALNILVPRLKLGQFFEEGLQRVVGFEDVSDFVGFHKILFCLGTMVGCLSWGICGVVHR